MTELPPHAAALLEQARRTHGPNHDERERVLSGLHATLGLGAAAAVAASSTATASATAAAAAVAESSSSIAPAALAGHGALGWKSALLGWKTTKVMLAAVTLGGAVGVGAVSMESKRSADAESVQRSTAALAARAAPARARREVAPAAPSAPEARRGGAWAERVEARAERVERAVGSPDPRATTPTAPLASARGAASAAPSAREAAREERRQTRRTRRQSAERRATLVAESGTAAGRLNEHSRRAEVVDAPASTGATLSPQQPVGGTAQTNGAPQPGAPTEAGSAKAAGSSAGELALLRAAMTSLRDHDAERALTLLAEHASRYPGGAFATERRGLRVVALCEAGLKTEGERERESFLREAARSPIAARVRTACGDK